MTTTTEVNTVFIPETEEHLQKIGVGKYVSNFNDISHCYV